MPPYATYVGLSQEQRNCYEAIVRQASRCGDECKVRILHLPEEEDGRMMILVGHARGDEHHHAGTGDLPVHQGIDPEATFAVRQIGAKIAALHEQAG